MTPRPLALSLVIIAVTIAVGLVIRFAPLGMPAVVIKYGASMLWASMIYWVGSSIFAGWRIFSVAFLAGVVATSVEFVKLYHSPTLDAFRLTLPGILILGRFFSIWDIFAYWLAIIAAARADRATRS